MELIVATLHQAVVIVKVGVIAVAIVIVTTVNTIERKEIEDMAGNLDASSPKKPLEVSLFKAEQL